MSSPSMFQPNIMHHGRSIEVALDMMPKIGIKVPDSMVKANLSDHDFNNVALDIHQQIIFYRQLITEIDDPLLGLKLAKIYRAEAFGIYGFAFLCAPTLRKALDFVIEYHDLAYTLQKMSFKVKKDKAIFSLNIDSLKMSPRLHTFYGDRDLGCMYHLLNNLYGERIPYSAINLTHDCKDFEQQYRDYFNSPINFNSKNNSLEFDSAILDEPLPYRNKISFEFCLQECKNLLSRIENKEDVVSQVKRQFALRPGYLHDIKSISSYLNMSERTLRRRLKEQKVTYQELRQEVRFEMACSYLINSKLSLSEIAEIIGYGEPANFTHAFKRWSHGLSPKEYRGQHQNISMQQ